MEGREWAGTMPEYGACPEDESADQHGRRLLRLKLSQMRIICNRVLLVFRNIFKHRFVNTHCKTQVPINEPEDNLIGMILKIGIGRHRARIRCLP